MFSFILGSKSSFRYPFWAPLSFFQNDRFTRENPVFLAIRGSRYSFLGSLLGLIWGQFWDLLGSFSGVIFSFFRGPFLGLCWSILGSLKGPPNPPRGYPRLPKVTPRSLKGLPKTPRGHPRLPKVTPNTFQRPPNTHWDPLG